MSLSRMHARISSPKRPLGAEPWIKAAPSTKSLPRRLSVFHVTVTAFSGGESTPRFLTFNSHSTSLFKIHIMIFKSKPESPSCILAETTLIRPFVRTRLHLSEIVHSAFSALVLSTDTFLLTHSLFSSIPHRVPKASTSCTHQPVQS
jgi:hypothetical protein